MKYLFTIMLMLFASLAYSQVVTIASIKGNNSNGEPSLNGQIRTVTGVVTVDDEFGGPGYMQDNTGGIAVFDSSFSNNVNIGDSVTVTGTITHFNGLFELSAVTYTLHSTNRIVTPQVVTISQILSQSCTLEQYEGMLLQINNVTINSSGTFGSNINYRMTDASGIDTVRIDNNTNIVGTNIPSGAITLIGVLGQFDASIPRCEGYQLQPRFLSDIVTGGGPNIIVNPFESDITSTGITLSWGTQSPGNTRIRYFVSDSIGQPVVFTDSVVNAALVTHHTVNLTNLRPGRIYYAQVTSTNGSGTSSAPVKYFSTASHPSSTGKWEVYFNFAVDTSVAMPNNKTNGLVDFKERLIQRIDSADNSIDIAMYSFNEINQIRDKLIQAVTRNVKIRIVYDHRDGGTQQLVQDLINAGIRVQRRPQSSTIMHNKFWIFDSRDTSSYSDDWLWGGSANITNAQFYSDAQNVILIQDQSLCNTYTREFEEMWGSHNDINSAANGKFGSAKSDNTPHVFNINGKKWEVYFSPSDNVSTKVESLIDTQTDKSINFCILAFTRFQIANEMKGEYSPPSKMVRGVFDRGDNINSSLFMEMNGTGGSSPWNPPAHVYLDNFSGLIHHKYILIDADAPQSNPVVHTGSFNFSNAATTGNDENVMHIYDSLIANQYYQEFKRRFNDAGGVISVSNISTTLPDGYSLSQNYPNPFNPVTSIEFSLPVNSDVTLKIYDVSGREVIGLINSSYNAGTYKVQLDASALSTGVYFYTLSANQFRQTKKMLLIK